MIDAVAIPEGERGPWKIERFTVDTGSINWMRLAMDGRAPHAGTYTALRHARRGIVMSDTTAERRDHWGFVVKAQGHVLINGLGLGMCLAAALKRPGVLSATVVELDADVIALVGPHYVDPRVTIVHASAFDYAPPNGIRYGAVWHDIWDGICEDNRPEMSRLCRKYGSKADWQDCWGRSRLNLERSRERRHNRYW